MPWGVGDQGVTGGAGVRGARTGGQDRTHVGGFEPAKRHRAGQRGGELVAAVGGVQGEEFVEFTGQAGVPDRRGPHQELFSDFADRAKLFLGIGFRSRCPTHWCAGPTVVGVIEDHLARCAEFVFGDDLAAGGIDDQQPPAILGQAHGGADPPLGHRVPHRRVPDTRELVDLSSDRRRSRLGAQRGRRPQHFPFNIELLGRHEAGVG